MTQSVEQTGHPSTVWAKGLQKGQHLFVCAARFAGEVIGNHVLQMKVTHRGPIRIAVRRRQSLSNRPLTYSRIGHEQGGGGVRVFISQQLNSPMVRCHSPKQVCSSPLEMRLVVIPIRRLRHFLGIWGQSQLLIWPGSWFGEVGVQTLHCRRRLPTGHFLTNNSGHQRIKDQIGSAKPDTRVGAVQFGDDRMIGREIAGVIPETADRAKSLNQPSGPFSP